jgi:uncharacterized OB-fold protein
MLVECEECTTTYPPDVANCPHCGTPNPQLEAHLAGTTEIPVSDVAESNEQPAEELPPNVRQSRKTETVQLPDQKENE